LTLELSGALGIGEADLVEARRDSAASQQPAVLGLTLALIVMDTVIAAGLIAILTRSARRFERNHVAVCGGLTVDVRRRI